MRDTLKVIDINGLNQINQHIIKKAVENKVFVNGTIDGYTVVAIDGTKFFGGKFMMHLPVIQFELTISIILVLVQLSELKTIIIKN